MIQKLMDGDDRFSGQNRTLDRALLSAGTVAIAENARCRRGIYKQRDGTTIPEDFNPAFSAPFVGSGVFNDPNGAQLLLIAEKDKQEVTVLQNGKTPYTVPYSGDEISDGGTNGSGSVEFVQAFDKILLLRKPSQVTNLVWDGSPGGAFEQVVLSDDGLVLIPPEFNGTPFGDRIAFYHGNSSTSILVRDTWELSDANDYTSYDPDFQEIRTNPAESDFITSIMAYFRDSLIIFKNQSIHQWQRVLPDTTDPLFHINFAQRQVSGSIGGWGVHMPLMVGEDVIFLSMPNGFYRLSEVNEQSVATAPKTISEAIQEVIDDINWGFTGLYGSSVLVDNYAYFGVARGGLATQCNTILVLNTQSLQWESIDMRSDPAWGFKALHLVNWGGTRRVFALDYEAQVVYMLDQGVEDELKTGLWPVPYKIETRGYTCQDPINFKTFRKSTFAISTTNPSIRLTAITDGVNEEKVLTSVPISKDRDKFYPLDHKDFDILTDDPTEPGRKDYSIADAELVAIEDFEDYPDGEIARLNPTGFAEVGPKQQSTERRLIRKSGRWVSLRIENDSGQCDLLAVSVEGTKTMTTFRTAA